MGFFVSLVTQPFVTLPMRPSSHTLTCSSIQHLYNNYTTTIQQPIQQLYNNSYFVGFGQYAPKIMIISFFLLLKLSCPRNTINMQLLYSCCMGCCIVVVYMSRDECQTSEDWQVIACLSCNFASSPFKSGNLVEVKHGHAKASGRTQVLSRFRFIVAKRLCGPHPSFLQLPFY